MVYNRTLILDIDLKDLAINIIYQALVEVHNSLYMFKDHS